MPKVVSFDCAETIIQLGWHPFYAMKDCSERAGIALPDEVFAVYGHLFLEWRPQYEAANLTRNIQDLDRFWDELLQEWLRRTDQPEPHFAAIKATVAELAYGPDNPWFRPFDDVAGCLNKLGTMGIRTCVISNWDLSLDRVLHSHGLAERFELILASLAEGYEKPDPELFRIALSRLGVEPYEVVHVGDNPVDDIEGAQAAGIPALLIDRSLSGSDPKSRTICSLKDLLEALTWND